LRREFDLWRLEQGSEWTTVGSRSKKSSVDVGSKCKRSFADVVHSSSAPRRPVFVRLNYPDNHFENFDDLNPVSRKIPVTTSPDPLVSKPKVLNPPAKPKHVLRWVQKVKTSGPALSQEQVNSDLKKAPSQGHANPRNSNSKAPSPDQPRPKPKPGPAQSSSLAAFLFQLLGPRSSTERLDSIGQV